jgi:hypothetical protein
MNRKLFITLSLAFLFVIGTAQMRRVMRGSAWFENNVSPSTNTAQVLASIGVDTNAFQPTNAALTALGSNPAMYQASNGNLTAWAALSTNTLPGQGYYGNGTWLIPLQTYVDGSVQASIWMLDTATNGHTFAFHSRYGNNPGTFAIYDTTAAVAVLKATASDFIAPGNISASGQLRISSTTSTPTGASLGAGGAALWVSNAVVYASYSADGSSVSTKQIAP